MAQLSILTSEFDPAALPAVLQAVHTSDGTDSRLQYVLADWWNGPGLFAAYEADLAALFSRPENGGKGVGDCIGGSAFGSHIDVTWRMVGSQFRAALVAEDVNVVALLKLAPSGCTWATAVDLEGRAEVDRWKPSDRDEQQVIFWGSECVDSSPANASTWIEARIPRPLRYPVQPQPGKAGKEDFEGVTLLVKAYHDKRGHVIVYRRHRLEGRLESEERKKERLARRDRPALDLPPATAEGTPHV